MDPGVYKDFFHSWAKLFHNVGFWGASFEVAAWIEGGGEDCPCDIEMRVVEEEGGEEKASHALSPHETGEIWIGLSK